MENKILDKKHIIIISIAILSIIVSYFNATYAYFGTSKNEEISLKSVASFGEATVYNFNDMIEGNLTYTTDKTNALKNTTLAFSKDNVEEFDYMLTVALQVKPRETLYELDEYTNITYEIYHKTDISLDTTSFTCTDKVSTNGEYCNTGTFIENSLEGTPFQLIEEFRISDTEMHYFDVYIYLNNNIESKMFKANIFYLDKEVEKEVEEAPEYINKPDLSTGLIPVVYDVSGTSSKWFVADTSQKWYSYTADEQWWANAVSVDSATEGIRSKYVNDDGTYKAGTEIAEADMLAMFVWIPRFSYTIGCTDESTCLGYKIDDASDLTTATPGAIDIKFVSKDTREMYTGDSPTYTYTTETDGMPSSNRTPSNWYTHPAFTFGEEQLVGIWVGKFETSTSKSASCYNSTSKNCSVGTNEVRILPNVTSMRYQKIANQFTYSRYFVENSLYGLKGDTHMMKNSEWGAVAYLSQSIYGKYGNASYTGLNKEIYVNNYYNTSTDLCITGVSGGAVGIDESDSIICRYNDNGENREDGTGECGPGASTTGNIYGIYDMVGGAYEYVMANYGTESNGVFTGTKGFSGFDFTTNIKYYDKFTTLTIFATKSKETIGQGLFETVGWYGDKAENFTTSYPWLHRGCVYDCKTEAGVFHGEYTGGGASQTYSFRLSLVMIIN